MPKPFAMNPPTPCCVKTLFPKSKSIIRCLEPCQRPKRGKIRPLFLPASQDIRYALVKANPSATLAPVPTLWTLQCLFFFCGFIESVRQVENGPAADQGFLVVIFDVDVEDMNWPIKWTAPVEQVVYDSIPASLLTSDDNVNHASLDALCASVFLVIDARHANAPVLPALGIPFSVPVAIQHVENSVGAVQTGILGLELAIHGVVGDAVEAVHIGLGYARAREADERASAKGDDGKLGIGELQMGFHGSVVVAGAHGAELELKATV